MQCANQEDVEERGRRIRKGGEEGAIKQLWKQHKILDAIKKRRKKRNSQVVESKNRRHET